MQVSYNLANPAHLDPADDGRSHAVWIRRMHTAAEPQGWYFLLPDVGLAIQLCNGACISWDGRQTRHCTSIASCIKQNDELYGYYFGLNSRLANAEWRLSKFRQLRREHSSESLAVGTHVWVRVLKNDGKARVRMDGEVCGMSEHSVEISFYSGKNARQAIKYALDDPNVVIAPPPYDENE